ncbi:MAG: PD40 domain-containing protein [Flavobacteriales bacterium]|nr:PD40 domain-containing protein [Flavobacteriales bacterium]
MKPQHLVLIAFSAGCTSPPPAEVADATPNLRIAFNVYTNTPEDNYEVFVMDLDGKNRKNITNTPGVEWVYAAHGSRLLFISDRDTCHRCYFLYEMDADGNNVRKISDRQLQDSWIGARLDGSEFLVDPKGINDTAFYRIDEAGKVLDTLYHGLAYANDPCFSPNGRQVVFRGSNAKFKGSAGYHDELYIINTDGSGRRQLTHYPANDTTAEWWAYHAGPPFWEPSSSRISYCSKRKGNLSIFSIKPDGTDEQQLTPDGFDEDWHAWSPDGSWLVYSGTPLVSEEERPAFDIFLMDLRTKQAKRLTTDTLTEQAPVFVRVVAHR